MRLRSPVSRGSFALRFSVFDIILALSAPGFVLWIRGAHALSDPDPSAIIIFWAVSFLAALIGFLAFRIRDGLTHLFSVHDALDVGKSVILTELITAFVMFTAARLDGIPRSILILHALFLIVGLVAVRATVRMTWRESRPRNTHQAEHVLFLGANKLTSLYIDFLRAYAPGRFDVVGILDDAPSMTGRSIAGVRVLGTTDNLVALVREFTEHGISISQVLVGGDPDALADTESLKTEQTCRTLGLQLRFIPALLGLEELKSSLPGFVGAEAITAPPISASPRSAYAATKRFLDVVLGLGLILVLAPIFPIVATLVFLDVGSPILFWQQRIGLNGRNFDVYKFRTLKATYDRSGVPIADSRMSWAGRLLRRVRLDELPQLLNVIIGDMSLIGPRPLLPKDQPVDPSNRLSVRPGITGWAQINGGTLLTAEDKNALDEWYVRNMSLSVDFTIFYRTMMVVFCGEKAPLDLPSALKEAAIGSPATGEPISVPAE